MSVAMDFLKKHKIAVMSAVLAVLVVCLVTVCVFVFGKKNSGDAQKTPVGENTSASNDRSEYVSGDSSFLFVCTDDSRTKIIYMALFDMHIYSGNIVVTPLDPDTHTDGNGTYSSVFAYGGMNMLLSAVRTVRNSRIDRYVSVTKNGFYDLFDTLGKVSVYISEPYTYESSDKFGTVERGENELDAAMLYTYVRLNATTDNGRERITSVICNAATDFMSRFKEGDPLAVFNSIMNCIDTDFTVSDYWTGSNDVAFISENDVVFTCRSIAD